MRLEPLWQALAPLLSPLGWSWGYLMRFRRRLYEEGFLPAYRPRAKVISIGNPTLGGEGKTPLVIWLANFLRQKGHNLAILTRGYGGRVKGPLVVSRGEGPLFPPEEVGDEAFLLALRTRVPLMVAKDRVAGAFWAQKEFEAEILLLDDGFQHLRLERDLDLVLVAADHDLEREGVFPSGRLREPLSALTRAHAFLITKTNLLPENLHLYPYLKRFQKPIFRIPYQMGQPYPLDHLLSGDLTSTPPLRKKDVIAFCGLGRAQGFFLGLEKAGYRLVERLSFGDHHRYSPEDLNLLISLREKHGVPLVTTEKDAVKLFPFVDELLPCYVFPVNPLPGADFERFVSQALEFSASR